MNITIEAMKNFAYFCANYPSDFIQKCFADDEHMRNHLQSKLDSIYDAQKTPSEIIKFILQLSTINQNKILKWIEDNYSYNNKKYYGLEDHVTEVWRKRSENLGHEKGTTEDSYFDSQADFFSGVMAASGIMLPIWYFSIIGDRNILEEYDAILKAKNNDSTE